MHRTDAPDNNGGLFQDENPQTATPGTVVDDDWLNAVQEEIVYLIEQAGIVLVKGTNTQLRQGVQKMITDAQKRVQLDQPTFAAGVADGDVVYWDDGNARFDKAIADTTNKNRAVGAADVSNGKVIAFGEAGVFAGLTPGGRYYLSDSAAGAITTTPPVDRVKVGIAKSATTLFVDIDALSDQADVLPMAQTVLHGRTDANGYANFLEAGTGLAVTLRATAVPLLLAINNGWNAKGSVGYLAQIAADAADAWSALTASTTLYLYIDRNPATGALTYGFDNVAPVYGYAHPAAPGAGDHSFLIPEGKLYEYSGAAWVEKQRVFVGECDTDVAAVTAVRTYALRGEYTTGLLAVAVNTAYAHNHFLGVHPRFVAVLAQCIVADLGYAIGDEVDVGSGGTTTSSNTGMAFWCSRLSGGFHTGTTSLNLNNKSTGANVAITPASWKYRLLIQRGW